MKCTIREDEMQKIRHFLKVEDSELKSVDAEENIKELVVARLTKVIGINFSYNYDSMYFHLFSNVVGEAVGRMFDLKMTIGNPLVRFFKYNGVNLVDHAVEVLNQKKVDEAFLDLYNFTEDFKKFVPQF